VQVPILSGIYTDETANFLDAYPVNMVPVPSPTGLSNGYLRTADGAARLGPGEGSPRGGINWSGVLFRVSGTKLIRIAADGTYIVIGDVGAGGQVTMVYSFDRLAIASGGNLWYWDGALLQQVVDPDLGTCLAVVWVDGYFVSTDGEYLVVTDLANPMDVNPLKYGSSEIDPDPIVTVLKLRNEVVAVNRYSIEFFNNVGGDLFPFKRIEGAQIQKGAISTHCAVIYSDSVAFLGGGRDDAPGVYLGVNGSAVKISTPAIDTLMAKYTAPGLVNVVLEVHQFQAHSHLWVRLPDRTLVYDVDSSKAAGAQVWFQLSTSKLGFAAYRVVDPVWCYDRWNVCDVDNGDLGVMTPASARVFGEVVRWEFTTALAYNEGRGAIWNQLELVCLTGRVEVGDDPVISTSYSLDGENWSQPRPLRVGKIGDRMRRLVWFQQGFMRNWRAQRFCGDSRARIAPARLEVQLEALAV
jgi:hypothetical protein